MARPWTRAQDAIVRKHPPREAARLTGHPLSSVYTRRFKLGLPDRRKVRFFHWTKAADKIVRDNSPPAAAKLLGVGVIAARRRRKVLGLPAWVWPRKGPPPVTRRMPRWTAREDRIVLTCTPQVAADRLKRNIKAIYLRRLKFKREGIELPRPDWGKG